MIDHEPAHATRRIAICVDDYGLHAGIDRAALELAAKGRISSISCLVDGLAWPAGSRALHGLARTEIGLHLDFTEGLGHNPLSRPLSRLILAAYARRVDRSAIALEISRQFDRFDAALGRSPDFIDGHQHVHQLPVIREALIEVLDKRAPSPKPWLRATRPPPRWMTLPVPVASRLKSKLIAGLGASALSRLASRHGYPQNRHLLGVYGFNPAADYLDLLKTWLQSANDGDLLMCHPAVSNAWDDPIGAARRQEYQTLIAAAFAALIEHENIEITPLRKETS